jgi:hypothetical protein
VPSSESGSSWLRGCDHSRDFNLAPYHEPKLVETVGDQGWSVELSKTWSVCPVNLRGFVGFGSLSSSCERTVFFVPIDSGLVQFAGNTDLFTCTQHPSTEGWAALQYHSVLYTTFSILLLLSHDILPSKSRLSVHLKKGSSFAIFPAQDQRSKRFHIQWHAGDIYAMEHSFPRIVDLPLTPCVFSHKI